MLRLPCWNRRYLQKMKPLLGPLLYPRKRSKQTCFRAADLHLSSQAMHQRCRCPEEPLGKVSSCGVKGSKKHRQGTHCPVKRTLSAHRPPRLSSSNPGRDAQSLTEMPTWRWPIEPWSLYFSSQLGNTEPPAPRCLSCAQDLESSIWRWISTVAVVKAEPRSFLSTAEAQRG